MDRSTSERSLPLGEQVLARRLGASHGSQDFGGDVTHSVMSTKRQRQEEITRESQPTSSSSCAAADTSMQIPDPQIPKPARQFLTRRARNRIHKRQRPAEVNTVWTIAGVYSGNEIATVTEDQKALHTSKPKELLNMNKVGEVEVVDRPQSQQVLSTRVLQHANGGTRI